MSNPLKQIGDTIIEVLLAIAVLSLVLSGAYAITNRDLNSIRAAQEHTEALKYAEAQMEQLRARATVPGNTIFSRTDIFCMNSGEQTAASPSKTMPIAVLNSATDSITYSANCTFTNGIDYHVAIDRAAGTAAWQHIFTVHVRWDGIDNASHDEVTLNYTLDQ